MHHLDWSGVLLLLDGIPFLPEPDLAGLGFSAAGRFGDPMTYEGKIGAVNFMLRTGGDVLNDGLFWLDLEADNAGSWVSAQENEERREAAHLALLRVLFDNRPLQVGRFRLKPWFDAKTCIHQVLILPL